MRFELTWYRKETTQERARRIYDQELRRQKRKDHLISRANGYALSPSPPPTRGGLGRDESITPPRIPVPNPQRYSEVDREEERGRMAYLEAEELASLESDPFSSYSMPDVHIPKRFRPSSPPKHASASASAARTREPRPYNISNPTNGLGGLGGGGRIPSMNGMNEDEYTTFIREGMDRLRNIKEQHHRDELRRQKERAAGEQLRREEADHQRREEKRRKRRREEHSDKRTDSGTDSVFPNRTHINVDEDTVHDLVRDSKALERGRYINLWQSLAGLGGEVEQVEMRYKDIPWPIYVGKQLDKLNIHTFLLDLSNDTTNGKQMGGMVGKGDKEKEKKVLRDAIRIFHPDRFFGRFLSRVRESDRDKVKEGVEVCSRVINALAAENAAR